MTTVPNAVPQQPLRRYADPAVALHWLIAALILLQLWLGFTFHDMPRGPERTDMFNWHKTVGALILLLTFVRFGYRIANPPPPFPPELPAWERVAAVLNHWLLYFLLFFLPITGLIAVSAHSETGTTEIAGGAQIPVIPGISEANGELSGGIHEALVLGMILLLALHVGAALKQQFFDRPGRMAGRMPPFQPRTDEPVVSEADGPVN